MKKLNQRDLRNLLLGCTVLGTGGGGSLNRGLEMIEGILDRGKEVNIMGLESIPDSALVASPYFCGSVSPEQEGKSPSVEGNECLEAFEALERHLDHDFFAAIPTEIGGANTAVAIAVAAEKGIPVVDADPAGRSVPELQHTTFYIKNVPIAPLAVANSQGDVIIVEKVASDFRAEKIVRSIAVASGNKAGVTDHPTRGKTLKNSVISGTLAKALRIGEAIAGAYERDVDPVKEAISAGEGFLLFKGRITETDWEEKEGFTLGNVLIEGVEDFKDNEYKIWYKNEHIISWIDEKIDVTVPDLICVLDSASGQPITNPNCEVGMNVSVIGYPAPDQWRTKAGLEVFGPKHFGYENEYRPIEENERLINRE